MAATDNFYTKEEILLELPKNNDKIRILIGHKNLRGEAKEYLDIRTWYRDDSDTLCPGKGFAKPLTREEIGRIAEVLKSYSEKEC